MIDCSRTENYFAEKQRMTKTPKGGVCELPCCDCPLCSKNNGTSENLSCTNFEIHYPEKAIEAVQKWSDAHPQRTYLSELLKIFPNTPLGADGTPNTLCPFELGLISENDCDKGCNCVKCWSRSFEESDKDKADVR